MVAAVLATCATVESGKVLRDEKTVEMSPGAGIRLMWRPHLFYRLKTQLYLPVQRRLYPLFRSPLK